MIVAFSRRLPKYRTLFNLEFHVIRKAQMRSNITSAIRSRSVSPEYKFAAALRFDIIDSILNSLGIVGIRIAFCTELIGVYRRSAYFKTSDFFRKVGVVFDFKRRRDFYIFDCRNE